MWKHVYFQQYTDVTVNTVCFPLCPVVFRDKWIYVQKGSTKEVSAAFYRDDSIAEPG